MPEVYIIAAVHTPIGIGKPDRGDLNPISPVKLAAHVLSEVVNRGGVEAGDVEDVIFGCVTTIVDQGHTSPAWHHSKPAFRFRYPRSNSIDADLEKVNPNGGAIAHGTH